MKTRIVYPFCSLLKDKSGKYAVTFRVRKSYKGLLSDHQIRHIRLFFILPGGDRNQGLIYPLSESCFLRATIRHNKRYILFLSESSESIQNVQSNKFLLASGPVQKSKAFVRSMKKYLCRNCGEYIS